jgi:cell division protein FtsN
MAVDDQPEVRRVSPDPEDIHEEEQDAYAPRSIFAAGWFRAVLVLTVLAIVVVVALPYLLNWFEPAPAPVREPARTPEMAAPSAPPPGASTQATAPAVAPPSPAPAPTTTTEKPGPTPVPPSATIPAPEKPSAGSMTAKAPARAVERPATASTKSGGARATGRKSYWVQLGLFKETKNAEAFAKKLRAEGISVTVARVTRSAESGGVPAGTYHVVRAGAYRDIPRATRARHDLQARGHFGFITDESGK